MEELSTSEVVLASMTPEEAREFNQGNKENTLIYRAAKAKAKRLLAEKAKTKTIKKSNKRPETTMERINRIGYEHGEKGFEKRPKHMDNKNIYSFEDIEILKNNINKKVAKKIPVIPPKPDMVNGHSDWNTDDWLESIDPGGWQDDKRSGILEQDLANEYWQTQFENYQNQGGTLSYQQWMQQQMNLKVSNEINKRIKAKQRTEGIAAILGIPGNKI